MESTGGVLNGQPIKRKDHNGRICGRLKVSWFSKFDIKTKTARFVKARLLVKILKSCILSKNVITIGIGIVIIQSYVGYHILKILAMKCSFTNTNQ